MTGCGEQRRSRIAYIGELLADGCGCYLSIRFHMLSFLFSRAGKVYAPSKSRGRSLWGYSFEVRGSYPQVGQSLMKLVPGALRNTVSPGRRHFYAAKKGGGLALLEGCIGA